MATKMLRAGILAVLILVLTACGGTDEDIAAEGDTAADTPTAVETTEPPETPTSTEQTGTPTDDDTAMDDMDGMDDMDEMETTGSFGEPADPAEADRTVEVSVDNSLTFDPDDFEAAVGEVITFRITNTGDIEHEFVLGDEAAQEAMAEEMAEGGDDHAHSGEMSNAVTVHGGETGEITWRFTEPGTVLIGCHVPGHYDAGMRGSVAVS